MHALVEVPADPFRVFEALRDALAGSGPAVLPVPDSPAAALRRAETHRTEVVAEVPKRVVAVVETSGTTGRPKRVMLSAGALLSSAAAAEASLEGPGQWLLALPAHYIAGLAVLVRSIAMETEPVALVAERFTAAGFASLTDRLEHPRKYTSLVPVQLARLLDDHDGLVALRRYDRVLLGGQAPAPSLLERAADAGVRVTVTYGATETCGGCVWDGAPIGDTRVEIIDGLVHITGAVLAEGYLDDPAGTQDAFPEIEGMRWHRTRDRGALRDGRLTVLGRADDTIVSGGLKVSLSTVEAVVRGMPGLDDAVVVPVERRDWGQAPAVITTGLADESAVRATLVDALGPAATPATVLRLDALPLLDSGKPDRVALTALAQQRIP